MEKHLVSGKKVERIKREQEAKVASALAGIDGEGNGAAAGRGLKPMGGGKVDKTQLSPWENKQLVSFFKRVGDCDGAMAFIAALMYIFFDCLDKTNNNDRSIQLSSSSRPGSGSCGG